MSDKVMQHCFDDIGTLEQMKAKLNGLEFTLELYICHIEEITIIAL